ncbi:hypothetical protein EDB84DRAFT_1457710, partial [Lactarius hengduanensis]
TCCHWLPPICPHHTSWLAKTDDLKARIPFLYFREGYRVKDICRILGLGKTLVYDCIRNHAQHHPANRPKNRPHSLPRGRRHIVKHVHVNFIRCP